MTLGSEPSVAGAPQPTVALLPWGDVVEDYLEPIGLTLEEFTQRMTGGWLFGYVAALARADVRCVIILFSSRERRPLRLTHAPSGTPIRVIPSPRSYVLMRRRFHNRYWWPKTTESAPLRRLLRPVDAVTFALAPYLATPRGALTRVLREERCTSMLCQEYEDPRFDVCVGIGRRVGLTVFGTFQGSQGYRTRVEGLIRPRSVRACSGLIIANASEAARVTARYHPPPKVARIFNPIDVNEWIAEPRDAARATLGIPADVLVVAWHGRISIQIKGLDILLAAWQRVRAALAPCESWLYLLGSGQDSARLRALELATEANGVRWTDEYTLDRARVRKLLSAADVYAFPSRREGLPVAPLEAMACGLPVVATDAPGISDIFEHGEADGGIVVPRDEVNTLAGALIRVLADTQLRMRLSERARLRVSGAFSLDSVGRQLRDLLVGPLMQL